MDARIPPALASQTRPAAPRRVVRPLLGILHRWVGLLIAGFLFVSGVTGAVISWDHELDDRLNPHLMHARTDGPRLPPLELAKRIEARDPRVQVTYIPLDPEPGETYAFGVEPKRDPATGKLFAPGYNQVFLDPVTGVEQGRRQWGAAWPITSETFVSFLYVLHYTLHIPAMWGIDRWGVWLMGVIAVLWTIDCFVGFYLTLPSRASAQSGKSGKSGKSFVSRWKPAWQIKTKASAYRINFDIHRAFGLWIWGVLFTVAFTAFSLNLYSEVFYPVLSKVSKTTPGPFELRTPAPLDQPILAKKTYAEVIATAKAEAAKRGWTTPAGGAFYSPAYGIYGVGFFEPGGDHGAAGVGPPYLYFDGQTGQLAGQRLPWVGTAADIFVQAQFPLHSGRILGLPGRILISLTGLVVAALSVTGVVIWWKKRKARVGRGARG
ncbi:MULTISPECIES: PepSY domain-containing protein [unclassified Caulobacter]|uniref:PepSY-associated TM helix domain-containing protein n=1 Tax=unclassified Caulobacter TaxID=2648921 RepID=UPI0009E71AB3|nr:MULTISPECIES: PepSY-associated TM helix domain-containing protein [unclassified Caulobacter]